MPDELEDALVTARAGALLAAIAGVIAIVTTSIQTCCVPFGPGASAASCASENSSVSVSLT